MSKTTDTDTTPEYWACDCEGTEAEPYLYIHSRGDLYQCPECETTRCEQPFCRVSEVKAAGLPLYPCPTCTGFRRLGQVCETCGNVGLVHSPELLVTGGTA